MQLLLVFNSVVEMKTGKSQNCEIKKLQLTYYTELEKPRIQRKKSSIFFNSVIETSFNTTVMSLKKHNFQHRCSSSARSLSRAHFLVYFLWTTGISRDEKQQFFFASETMNLNAKQHYNDTFNAQRSL